MLLQVYEMLIFEVLLHITITFKSHVSHDDVIKWKRFPRCWPFMRETTGHRWIPLIVGQ